MTSSGGGGHVISHLPLLMLVAVVTQVVPGRSSSAGARSSPVNDDAWHTVFVRRQADTFQMSVDDRHAAPVTGRKHRLALRHLIPIHTARYDSTPPSSWIVSGGVNWLLGRLKLHRFDSLSICCRQFDFLAYSYCTY